MSKHVLPPTSLDDLRTVWIQPDPDPKSDPGWRLRLDWMRDDNAFLFEEQVLPERVDNPNANRIINSKASIQLTRANAEWLRDALTDFLDRTTPQPTVVACRRCSECVGQEHHWMENDDFEDESDPEFACKHCDAKCHAIGDDEAEHMEPSGVVIQPEPRADG